MCVCVCLRGGVGEASVREDSKRGMRAVILQNHFTRRIKGDIKASLLQIIKRCLWKHTKSRLIDTNKRRPKKTVRLVLVFFLVFFTTYLEADSSQEHQNRR